MQVVREPLTAQCREGEVGELLLDLSVLEFVVVAVIVFLSALIQGIAGFGLGIIAAPFAVLVHPELVPGPVLFVLLISSLLAVWKYRGELAIGELSTALVGRVPGTLVAMVVLTVASRQLLQILLGTAVLAAVFLSVRAPVVRRTPMRLFLAGNVSGFMATTTSVGGPPIALIYQNARGRQARANLGGYFFVGTLGSLLALWAVGEFTPTHLRISVLLIAPAILGFIAANALLPLVRSMWLRPALLILCTGAGVTALARGLVAG